MIPQLLLVSQDSLLKERSNKNGICRDAHVVCKNLPFSMELEIKNGKEVDFNSKTTKVTATLLHDWSSEEEAERLVETQNGTGPMEFRVYVNDSKHATLECRLKVLTSQLQTLFRVKVVLSYPSSDKKNTTTTKSITAMSNAIKVISKAPTTTQTTQRKTANETISEMLSRLEDQNKENENLLQSLVNGHTSSSIIDSSSYTSSPSSSPMSNFVTSSNIPDPSDEDFSSAFQAFLASYKKLDQRERPSKLRKTMCNISNSEIDNLHEFVTIAASSPSPSNYATSSTIGSVLTSSSDSITFSPNHNMDETSSNNGDYFDENKIEYDPEIYSNLLYNEQVIM